VDFSGLLSNSSVTNTHYIVQYVQQVQQEKIQIINQAININGVTGADLESKRWKVMSNRDHCLLKRLLTKQIIEHERDASIDK
jgi:L-cysteine desulfidase